MSWFTAGGVVGLRRTGSDEAESARGDLRRRACVSVGVCVCVCVRESAWQRESSKRGRASWMPFVSRSVHRVRKRKRARVRVCVCACTLVCSKTSRTLGRVTLRTRTGNRCGNNKSNCIYNLTSPSGKELRWADAIQGGLGSPGTCAQIRRIDQCCPPGGRVARASPRWALRSSSSFHRSG